MRIQLDLKNNMLEKVSQILKIKAFWPQFALLIGVCHVCMKATLITQGKIQYGGLILLFDNTPMILTITREYHSIALIPNDSKSQADWIDKILMLMLLLRDIKELFFDVYSKVWFTVFAPDTATHKHLFVTLRTQEFQEELLYLVFFHGLTQTKPKLPYHN